MLKAYIDDSHTMTSAFVLAGYIAPAENWAAFSDDWQELLDMSPPLVRFKMAEAHGTWSEQQWNERLPMFYETIERHAVAGISLVIPSQEYARIFGGKKYAKNPYHIAFLTIIAQLALRQDQLGLTEPVDFIFDKGNHERIAEGWNDFVKRRPPEVKGLLGKRPIFGDDEKMLPLQAADMLAWLKRRRFQTRLNSALKSRKASWRKTRELYYLDLEMSEETMQRVYDQIYGKN